MNFFVDLSYVNSNPLELHDYLNCLALGTYSPAGVGQITLALPVGAQDPGEVPGLQIDTLPGQPAALLLERAVARAAALRRNLVVLLGLVVPGADVLRLLAEALDRDPMFGTAQPRFSEVGTDRLWPLPPVVNDAQPGPVASCAALAWLPACTITAELVAACMVLRWNMLVAADGVEQTYSSVAGALLQLLCQTRRRGMRNVVVNSAVVPSQLKYAALYPALSDVDLARLRAAYPDTELAEAELAELPQRRLEPLLTELHDDRTRRRILLDCRGMPPRHNGSAQSVLGFLDGFAGLDCAPQLDILVWPDVAEFHGLPQRYRGFRHVFGEPDDTYLGAIGLTQPWDLKGVADLHRHALVVAFAMLDTIAWDILYANGARALGTVWRFIARHADGLVYNSCFTRERFRTRFAVNARVNERVIHYSLRADEYVLPAARSEPLSDHILLFGNDFDHKDVRRTLELLVDAFPFNPIVAFGLAQAPSPSVVAVASGELDQTELHRLIAGARVIVYPSFYEGFGLPVVEGLAYGRPVVVRRSPLWTEIAGRSQLPGELIEFDDAPSLVEAVGRVLAGLPNEALPRGADLADCTDPAGWKESAARVIELIHDCASAAHSRSWYERDEALGLAGL
jgi:glycosyltransferase involved in cell wall biosynthesis